MSPVIAETFTAFPFPGTWLIGAITFGFVVLNLALHFSRSYYAGSPMTTCHSEGEKRPKNLAQDRLRQESRPFAIAQGDRINSYYAAYFLLRLLDSSASNFRA